MQEYELDKTYQRGARGKGVRKIQEWLSLHDIQVVIDGSADHVRKLDFRTVIRILGHIEYLSESLEARDLVRPELERVAFGLSLLRS